MIEQPYFGLLMGRAMDPVTFCLHDVEFDRCRLILCKRGGYDFSAECDEMVGSDTLIMVADTHPERASS